MNSPEWALVTSAVTSARVETHRVQHLVARIRKVLDSASDSDQEVVYRLFGDAIHSLPENTDRLESNLDKASKALSDIGSDHFRKTLSPTDRSEVEDVFVSVKRIARDYKR